MLDLFALTQLTCRASNAAERLIIVKQLKECSTPLNFQSPLNKVDLQAVNEDLERLFPSSAPSQSQGTFYRIKRQAIKRSLRLYRWIELNLKDFSAAQQQILLAVHAPWVSNYIEAIAQVAQISHLSNLQDLSIPVNNIAAQGCLPFLKLIETELMGILEVAQQEGLEVAIHPRIVASVQQFFWQRVEIMVTSAMTEAAPSLQSELEAHSSLPEAFHAFYLRFPVLARWLSQASGDTIHLVRQAIARLVQDRHDLSQQFWDGVAISRITDCQFVQAQDATEEHPILQIEFGLTNGPAKCLIYCPYSIQAEVGLQQLYAEVSTDPVKTHSILAKRGYGYIEEAKQPSNLEPFQEIGCYLAIRQLLGSSRGIWGQLQIGIAPRGGCRGEMPWSSGVRSPKNFNIPQTDSKPFNVEEAIQRGFERMDQWLRRQPQVAALALNTHFAYASAQLCYRPAATYLKIFRTVQSAPCLANPLAVDAVFRTLSPCRWDGLGELAQLEVKMLWQFNALWLTIPMNHRYILYEAEHALFSKLPISPLDYLSRRVQRMSAHDCPPKWRDERGEPLKKLLV
jgi:Domain of unknown function (DUF4135)